MTEEGLPTCVEDYAELLDRGTSYCQVNYGDGEWACMLGKNGSNCNGEAYSPVLGDLLRGTLTRYAGQWCGSNPGKKIEAEAKAWILAKRVWATWVDKEVLPSANVNGKLRPWLDALKRRDVILVGPQHLAELPDDVFGAPRFLKIPDAVAWKHVDETCGRICRVLRPGDVLLVASGMATNLTLCRLWPMYAGEVVMHDVGALFDPYVGVWSRNGYRKEIFQTRNILLNLGKA